MADPKKSAGTPTPLVLLARSDPFFRLSEIDFQTWVRNALTRLKERNVPLVLYGHHSAGQMREMLQAMGIRHPYIGEYGGGVFYPKGEFPGLGEGVSVIQGDWEQIPLGKPHADTVKLLKELQAKRHGPMSLFSEMGVREISEKTGFTKEEARLAKKREFSELVVPDEPRWSFRKYVKDGSKKTFFIQKEGPYYFFSEQDHLAMSVRMMGDLFRYQNPDCRIAAIGWRDLDHALLQAVQMPIVLKDSDGKWTHRLKSIPNAVLIDAEGLPGFSLAVQSLLQNSKE